MNKENKHKTSFRTAEVVTLVLITCIVSLLMGIIISKPNQKQSYELADEEIQNFIEQYNYIVNNYYEEVDKKEVVKVEKIEKKEKNNEIMPVTNNEMVK